MFWIDDACSVLENKNMHINMLNSTHLSLIKCLINNRAQIKMIQAH